MLTNPEAIAINQKNYGYAGICSRYYDPWHCLYKKELTDGSICFLILNRCHGNVPTTIEYDIDLDISKDTSFEVYDIWEHRNLGEFTGTFSVDVQTSDVPSTPCCGLYKITIKQI